MGKLIGAEAYPSLVIQEGGYRTQTLGSNAKSFFKGLYTAHGQAKPKSKPNKTTKRLPLNPQNDFREHVHLGDIQVIQTLTAAAQVFSAEEIMTAGELVANAVHHGEKKSGYSFLLFEAQDKLLAYTCYGHIALTESSYDLYWIVVDPRMQGQGIAKMMMQKTIEKIKAKGGTSLYAETSSFPSYAAARKFYQRLGFKKMAVYPDFTNPPMPKSPLQNTSPKDAVRCELSDRI